MQPLGRCLQKTQRVLRTSSLSPELTANFPRSAVAPGSSGGAPPCPLGHRPTSRAPGLPLGASAFWSGAAPPPPCTRPRPPPRSTTRASWRCSEVSTGPGGPVMPAGDPIGLTLWGTQPAHNRASWGQPCALHAKAGGQRCRAPRTAVHRGGSPRRGTWRRLGGASLLPTGTHGRGRGRGQRAAEEQGAGRAGAEGLDRASAEPGGAVASGSSAVCEPTGASVVCAAPPSFQIQERVSNAARGHCAGQTAGQDTGPAA